jgi:hypothetical protein
MKQIKITIHPDGTQTVEVLGAVGDSCLEITRALEARLGQPVGERVLKPEFEQEKEVETEQEREADR